MEDTREQTLDLILRRGRVTVAELATELRLTRGGLRRHLDRLRADGLVQVELLHQDMGRPLHVYLPTEEAEGRRAHYARLTERFIQEVTIIPTDRIGIDGESLLTSVLHGVGQRIVEEHRSRVAGGDLSRRVEELTTVLSEEGILSGWARTEDGYVLINATCPYRKVAAASGHATCGMDREIIESLLGVPVEQVGRLVDGEVRCEYVVRPDAASAESGPKTGVVTS